ncbi:Ig-like domain-containing protein [Vibrio astriarenae]|uniref:Ig-like domain-containing protein n=1 Tax=Vibrio astriarenae TaxID=1481923 RepID=UPI0037368398
MKAWHWSVALPVVVLTGCNSSSGDNPPPPTDSLTSVSITSKPTDMFIGESMTLGAKATWSSGKTEDITQSATWTVTPMDAAKVDGTTLTAQKISDAATLTLNYQTFSDTAVFVIRAEDEDVELTEIELSSFEPQMVVGETQQLSLIAKYSDDSEKDVTALAQWQSQDEALVQVDSGKLTASGPGKAQISYSYQSLSDTAHVEILDILPELTGIEIRELQSELVDGYSMTLHAWAQYDDAQWVNITQEKDVHWLSSDNDIASFSSNVLQSHAEGETNIELTFGDMVAQESVTVTPAQATEILPNITSDNTLHVIEGEQILKTIEVTLSNGKKESFPETEINFVTGQDEQGFRLFEESADEVRVLRSGQTTVRLSKLSDALRQRFDELNIGYTNSVSEIILDIGDNSDIYQWNRQTFERPNNGSFYEIFSQGNKVYYIWNMSSGNTLLGLAATVFDGSTMSEPVMLLEGVKAKQYNYMVDGGGNGYFLYAVENANREVSTYIFDTKALGESAHKIDFASLGIDMLPNMERQSGFAFDSQGRLVFADTEHRTHGPTRLHRYTPATQSWEEDVLIVDANRIGQQMTHPDHLMLVNAPSNTTEPRFYFVDLDSLTVEYAVTLTSPQGELTQGCGYSDPRFAVSLTKNIEKFAVYCFGYDGSSAAQRLLWETPENPPTVYTPPEGASITNYEASVFPFVAHVDGNVVASHGTITIGSGNDAEKSVHIDTIRDETLHTYIMDETAKPLNSPNQTAKYIYSNFNSSGGGNNLVMDSSKLSLQNPYVPEETVFVYRDAISVWNSLEQDWVTDHNMFGTQYLKSFSSNGNGYLYTLNGEWHFVKNATSGVNRVEVTSFQMRQPESSKH